MSTPLKTIKVVMLLSMWVRHVDKHPDHIRKRDRATDLAWKALPNDLRDLTQEVAEGRRGLPELQRAIDEWLLTHRSHVIDVPSRSPSSMIVVGSALYLLLASWAFVTIYVVNSWTADLSSWMAAIILVLAAGMIVGLLGFPLRRWS